LRIRADARNTTRKFERDYAGGGTTQQPVKQYWPSDTRSARHAARLPAGAARRSHAAAAGSAGAGSTGPPVPPVPPVPVGVQSGGKVGFADAKLAMPAIVVALRGLGARHALAASLIVSGVHSEPSRTSLVPPPGRSTEQQPKQSHPFGVPVMQKSMQAWLTMQSGSVIGLAPVKQSVW
jgi:hypothetical protein